MHKDWLVHSFVAYECGILGETLSTLHTNERLWRGNTMMSNTVTFYLRRSPKALTTFWARVTNGGVSLMAQPLVFDQASSVCKAPPTFRAVEWAGTCVRSLMLGQVLALGETAATVSTGVRALSCMDALVLDQVRAPAEALTTLMADIGFLTSMCALVLH